MHFMAEIFTIAILMKSHMVMQDCPEKQVNVFINDKLPVIRIMKGTNKRICPSQMQQMRRRKVTGYLLWQQTS